MDNQQRKTSESNIGWVAGLIDGEGTCIFHTRKHGNPKRTQITPTFVVTNTDEAILNRLVGTLDDLGLAYYVRWTESRDREGRFSKNKWEVWVQGYKRLERFISVFIEHVTKRRRFELLQEFILMGQKRWASDRTGYRGSIPYSDREWELVNQLKVINHPVHIRLKRSETTCPT